VEDDITIQRLMSVVVKSMKCGPLLANNYEEALEYVKLRKIDLALIDLGLPLIDGIELSRRIKLIKPEIPIILMSGVNLDSSSALRRLKGFTDFIAKPFDIKTVTKKIRTSLNVAAMTGQDEQLGSTI
jgi:DNA-binding response OmpR family regulator